MSEDKSCTNCKWDCPTGCSHVEGALPCSPFSAFILWEPKEIEAAHKCSNCKWNRPSGCTHIMGATQCEDYILWEPREKPSSILKHKHVDDKVNHPSHYTQGMIEVLDAIQDWKMNYIEGNIIKYVARYKFKNGKEDLEKAQFYLNKLIEDYDV